MKVLHIVNGLNPGGIEKWLHDLLLVEPENDVYILKQDKNEGFFEQSLKRKGIKIICIPKSKIFYIIRVLFFIRQGGFDVVHSHLHYSSGMYMFISYILGVKCRVTHSHIYTSEEGLTIYRDFYKNIMKFLIKIFSNVRIAVSENAGKCIFEKKTFFILPCGIELKKSIRDKVEYPSETIRIGHVGRFSHEKNHELMFRVAEKLRSMEVDFKMIFMGEGVLKQHFVEESLRLGLQHYIEFRNPSISIADFLSYDIDLFLFPSKFEGLGLSLIEAQYYGIPSIISSKIPSEALFGNYTIFDLNSKDADENIARIIKDKVYLNNQENLNTIREAIKNSFVNVDNNRHKLNEIYMNGISRWH